MYRSTIQEGRWAPLFVDEAETVDGVISLYAEIGWEDDNETLLGRVIVVRDAGTDEVHAIGSYRPHRGNPFPVVEFLLPRDGVVVRFSFLPGTGTVVREDYRVRD